jgi:signal transduction histidine kinase
MLAQEQLRVKQRNFWAGILVALVTLVSVVGWSAYRRQTLAKEQLRRESELKQRLAKSEFREGLEKERVRISRDLHDHIGAQLTIISSKIDQLAFKEKSSDKRASFDQISDYTNSTMAQLRETIWAMNNEEVKLPMLLAKLRDLANKALKADQKLVVEGRLEDDQLKLGPAQTINVFRSLSGSYQ